MSRWDSLTMAQKAELIGIAVRNGVTGLEEIRNIYEMGGPKRQPMPKHPSRANIDKDSEAYAAYENWQQERNEERERNAEEYKRKVEEKSRRNEEAAIELNRRKDVVMSTLSDIANSVPFTGSEVRYAADQQRQEKVDKFHELKKGMDAATTAAELVAAGYGVTRGLTHLNRQLARQAAQSTGQVVSRDALQNLLKWNKRVEAIDKPQVAMNTLGGIADAYQLFSADNSFDAWENGLETGANAAGVVGGMNWFRNLPLYTKFGNTIDNVLDGLGYGAAAWDVVKYLPPLSGALENIRQQSINNENKYGGNLNRSRRFDNGGFTNPGEFPPLDITPLIKYVGQKFSKLPTSVQEVRNRLYNNLVPVDYDNITKRLYNSIIENEPYSDYDANRDDIFATYLGIPEQERHNIPGKTVLQESKYVPTKNNAKQEKYYSLKNIDNSYIDNVINDAINYTFITPLKVGENKLSLALNQYLGEHTISRGYDKKGDYVSYYDLWDLNPFAGLSPNKEIKELGLANIIPNKDMSFGIGIPVNIYDRIYLDDYYNVPEPTHSTYLPEVTIRGKNRSNR